MRVISVFVLNLFRILGLVVWAPVRLWRSRRRPRWVEFRLEGDLAYRNEMLRRRGLFSARPDPLEVLSLEDLERQLKLLGADPKVDGIVLRVEGLELGHEKLELLGRLVEGFRRQKKRVLGYSPAPSQTDYRALCLCDEVWLSPAGRLELLGFSAEGTNLGAALTQLGVRAHFVRRGEHKTAPELFTDELMSEVQRATLSELLGARFSQLVAAVARGRKLSVDEVRAKVDRGPFSAKRALSEGLCDRLISEADLFPQVFGPEAPLEEVLRGDWHAHGFASYARRRLDGGKTLRRFGRPTPLAYVPVQGMIISGDGSSLLAGRSVVGADALVRRLRELQEDASRAVLLHVESPGGSAFGSELVLDEVRRLCERKPVVAYCERVAASGGYMVALGAKEIWSAADAVIGSIGVFAGKLDLSGLLESVGIRRTAVQIGQNAGMQSLFRGFSASEQKLLELDVEETYQSFLAHVSRARTRSVEEIHTRAEGRVYTAAAALDAGLIDRVGAFDAACRRALELAQVTTPTYHLQTQVTRSRRLDLLSFARQLARAQVYALWEPGLW